MNPLSSKRRTITTAAVVLLLLFLLRPGASPLKSRIIASISSAVGRSVDIGSVHLRLLPRPGFDLQNLVVYDDPAFGAEPMLRATDVTADLRMTSLLRGRLEVARLDLTEPSLNLVHGDNGGWNVEALLERSAHMPLAPTSKAKSEPRPGFPYIQAATARINFKNGSEKKPFALTNADFSLWQESENTWGVRLKAQPVRTDMNLSDIGLLQIDGTWQRAPTLRDTPLDFTMEWSRAQLGQLTKLFSGFDRGWRGGSQLDVSFHGTPSNLQIASDASIQDFRRYDITSGEALRIAAHCSARYSSLDHRFHELLCNAPVGAGMILLKGETGLPGQHIYALVASAEEVPAAAAIALAQRSKANLPNDLTAQGFIRGTIHLRREGPASEPRFDGQGEIDDFLLSSAESKSEIGPTTIPFVLVTDSSSANAAGRGQSSRRNPAILLPPNDLYLDFGPFPLAIGHNVTARAWVTRTGYDLHLAGEAEISKTLPAAHMIGLPALQSLADGAAPLDLQVAGTWARSGMESFPAPEIVGTAKLRNVHVPIRGANDPVEITSADLELSTGMVQIRKLNAKAADTLWTGSLELPRGCRAPAACEVHFNLNTNQISVAEVLQWTHPRPRQRSWFQVLESTSQAGPTFLGSLRASGRVTADRLQVKNLALSRASANVQLNHGQLRISDLKGDTLGGSVHADWLADYSLKPASCSSSGKFDGITLSRLGALTKKPTTEETSKASSIAGTASASYQIKGSCTPDFLESAEGTLQFEVMDGTLGKISLPEDEKVLRIAHMSGQARLRAGEIEMKDVMLDSADGNFLLSGAASFQREPALNELDLKMTRMPGATTGYSITGTLAEPRVAPLSRTEQARLKQNTP